MFRLFHIRLAILRSKKQNVAQNVAWVWQTNATTQHRRFFVATLIGQNEHVHFAMLQHVAWNIMQHGWHTGATFDAALLHKMFHHMLHLFDQRFI